MKWIIVNLYHTPDQLTAGTIEERRTIDVDDVRWVKQIRKQVKRDKQIHVQFVTQINLNSEGYVECTDAFKHVVQALQLVRLIENKQRKAGNVFVAHLIDVQETFGNGVYEIDLAQEQGENDNDQ